MKSIRSEWINARGRNAAGGFVFSHKEQEKQERREVVGHKEQ